MKRIWDEIVAVGLYRGKFWQELHVVAHWDRLTAVLVICADALRVGYEDRELLLAEQRLMVTEYTRERACRRVMAETTKWVKKAQKRLGKVNLAAVLADEAVYGRGVDLVDTDQARTAHGRGDGAGGWEDDGAAQGCEDGEVPASASAAWWMGPQVGQLVTSAVVAGGAGDDGEDWRDPAVNPYLLTGDELDRAANFVG